MKLTTEQWIAERVENCERLAQFKSGEDRQGWLEDASYFRDVLKRLSKPPTEELSSWIPVTERLPEGKRGVPYMTFMTDVVLVLHKDRPDYPLTAHAALGDDLDTLGVRIPTNGASKYKWISWHSIGRDGSNPFDLAGLRDAYGYERKMPSYLGHGITHWMPLPTLPSPQAQQSDAT